MACKREGLVGIHHKIQDSQQKVRTYPLGSRFAGRIPPNERNPFIACVLEQTIKPKHEVSGSQHDNTMFFLGTEAPMVAALGRCGSLRDTCAAIHSFVQPSLKTTRMGYWKHVFRCQTAVSRCLFLHVSDMANMARLSCSPKTHEAQKRGAPPKVLNRQRKIIATVQFWKNISTNISC